MAKAGSSAKLNVQFNGSYNKSQTLGGNLIQNFTLDCGVQFSDGNAANQFNRYKPVSGTATDTPAAAVDFSGTTTDAFGDTTDWTKVRLLAIKNTGATNDLLVGGESTDIINMPVKQPVGPGGFIIVCVPTLAGMPVTTTTKDKLSVACATGLSTTYEIYAWGSA